MNGKIGIIGFGTIGKLFLEKFLDSGLLAPEDIFVSNRSPSKLEKITDKKVNVCLENRMLVQKSDYIFFCVKPSDLKTVFDEVKDVLSKDKYIVSVNGSIKFSQLEKYFPENRISKIIPSVTAEVNSSQTLVCHNEKVVDEDFAFINQLLCTFGNVINLPENEIGMGSELVSCMPGFIASIFNEIAKGAGKHTEIPEDQRIEMLLNTMIATGLLIKNKKQSFYEVIEKVATKGGITEEGVKVIEKDFPHVVDELFEKTLEKRRLTEKRMADGI